MSIGEYDTPGPYRSERRAIYMGECAYMQASLGARMDPAEQEEFIGLLNKGTHFEGLLGAAKAMIAVGHSRSVTAEVARDGLRAAIAKAEPPA